MEHAQSFDLIVIGTGSGGSVAAGKCAKAGWNVAQIDSRPFGGTCALRGCDPKKILVGAAELIDHNHRMQQSGITGTNHIEWNALMEYKRTFTEPVPESRERSMEKQGIVPIHGRASFINKNTIQVDDKTYSARHFLIATGAKPAPLSIDGFQHIKTSTDFLEMDTLPKTLVFVGGGYISFEFAHIAARAGSTVHIIHRGERPLEHFDPDMVDILLEKTSELSIQIHLEAEVQSVSPCQKGFEVLANQQGRELSITGDGVVHGAGRVPNIEELDLENAGIPYNKHGIIVNEYLQNPNNERIYAAGDVADTKGKPLTPVGGYESHIVVSNLLKGNHRKAEYPAQPSMVFTIPPLAAVGLSEEQARRADYDVKVKKHRTDSWYSSRRTNETHTGFKLIIDKSTDTVLGAHIVGEHASEHINMLTMAINKGITTRELKQMIFAYPTHSSNLQYMF